MRRLPLFVSVSLTVLLLLSITLAVFAFYSTRNISNFHQEQMKTNISYETELAAAVVQTTQSLSPQELCHLIRGKTENRATIIDKNGVVLGDSHKDPGEMDNHRDRPEILTAWDKGTGSSKRFSSSLNKEMLYFAKVTRLNSGEKIALRLAVPLTQIQEDLAAYTRKLILAALILFGFILLLGLYFARRVSRPLELTRRKAIEFAKGNLEARYTVEGSSEFYALSQAMNLMAEKLGGRLETIQKQQSELDAVFGSMKEGVVALNRDHHVLTMNKAASSVLQISLQEAYGKDLRAVIRNSELRNFLHKLFEKPGNPEREMVFQTTGGDVILQVKGSPLIDQNNRIFGALVVFNNITHLRKLEGVRRDFVANVSHEIKTPISSIKAAAETLLGKALENRETALKFIRMIAGNADRLHEIVEDLLNLSRIEQEDVKSLQVSRVDASELFTRVVRSREQTIEQKSIQIKREIQTRTPLRVNDSLMEQAMVNLLDNAVKYSPEGGEILLRATGNEREWILEVEDFGPGIPEEYLPRLFERFYRVDEARSRKLGGSGLGLAIVKHIAQLHGGRVQVSSEVNRGSAFSVHLPKKARE